MAKTTPHQTDGLKASVELIANLSHQAHYQIEAMCFALRNAAIASDTDALPYLVQSLSLRIIELNAGLMNLLDGNERDFEYLKHSVFGVNSGETA